MHYDTFQKIFGDKLFVPWDKQNMTEWRTDGLTKRFIYIEAIVSYS